MISHLRSMLGRLQSLFPQRLRQAPWLVFFGLAITFGFVFYSQTALAEFDVVGGLIKGVGWIMITIANIAIGLTIFFLRFFIAIAAYNNYIDVSVVQLGWIMVRDVANMFFVIALLVIAFGTILGLEEYEWKKNLVKLILAAILINFSNLIAQLVIDVAHVFTITFLNAISATAGGNLINMFKLDQMTALVGSNSEDWSSIDVTLLAAAIPAMMFAIMAAFALGSYVVVMMARVVALWALIILSPLAFILGVLPKTKSYAEKWWSEFSKYVIVAPIMVFFLWLSFATLGQGNIASQIQSSSPALNLETAQSKTEYGPAKLSLSKVTTWENMANFLIAFAFLMYGIKTTQETGVIGSEAVGSAVSMAKTVGRYASGYAAARYLGAGAAELAKKGVKGALWHAPLVGGEKWVNRAKTEWGAVRSWYYGKGASIEVDQIGDKINDKNGELTGLKKKEAAGTITADEAAKMPKLQKEIDGLQKQQKGFFTRGGIVGMIARGGLSEERRANKSGKLADQRREIAYKRSGSGSGGFVFGTGGALRKIGLGDESFKDQDRTEKGILEIEEKRSDTKTGVMSAKGALGTLGRYRIKDGKMEDQGKEGEEAMTMAEQISAQQEDKSTADRQSDELMATAKQKFFEGKKGQKSLTARITADLNIKASEAETKRMEESGLVGVAMTDKKNSDLAKQIYERSRAGGATKEAAIEGLVKQGLVSEDLARQMGNAKTPEEEKALLNGVLGRTIASEKATHLAGIKKEKLEKTAETEFLGSEHGRLELEEEADLQNEIGDMKNNIEGMTTAARTRLTLGDGGLTDEEINHEAHGDTAKADSMRNKREALRADYKKRSDSFLRSEQNLASIKDEETTAKGEAGNRVKTEDQKKRQIKEEAIAAAIKAAAVASLGINAAGVTNNDLQKNIFKTELAKELAKGVAKAGTEGITIDQAEVNLTERETRTIDQNFSQAIEAENLRTDKEDIDKVQGQHAIRQSALNEFKRVTENIGETTARAEQLKTNPTAVFESTLDKIIQKINDEKTKIDELQGFTIDDALKTDLVTAETAVQNASGDDQKKVAAEKLKNVQKLIRSAVRSKGISLVSKFTSSDLDQKIIDAKVGTIAEKQALSLDNAKLAIDGNLHKSGFIDDPIKTELDGFNNVDALKARLEGLKTDQVATDFVKTNSDKVAQKLTAEAETQKRQLADRFSKEFAVSVPDLKRVADSLQSDQTEVNSIPLAKILSDGLELEKQSLQSGLEGYRKAIKKSYEDAVRKVHGVSPHLSESQVDELVKNPDQVQGVYLGGILEKTAAERSVRAKKRAHTSDLYGKSVDKEIERRDTVGYEGRHEIELDARYESEAEAVDNFTKQVKSVVVKSKFEEADGAIKKVMAEFANDRKRMVKELDLLSEKINDTQAAFVRKIRSDVFAKLEDEDQKEWAQRAQESAKSAFYEIPVLGKATPSTAMDSRIATAKKDLQGQESADGAAMAAKWIGSIMRKRGEGQKIDSDAKSRLFAAITHITSEAWTDDTISEISALFQDLDSGRLDLNSDDGRDAKALKDIFVDQLHLIEKNAEGKYVSFSNPANSAALQAMVSTGGNMNLVKSHILTGTVSDSLQEKDYDKKSSDEIKKDLAKKLGKNENDADLDTIARLISDKKIDKDSGYEKVAKVLADEGNVLSQFGFNTFKDFDDTLDSVQEIMQEASTQFKRAALNTKHLQNGGHQAYDARWGGSGKYRLMTQAEAANIIKAETVKREGMGTAQHHSFGTVDNNKGRLVKIDPRMFGILTAGILDASKVNMLTRTMDNVMGYGSGEKFEKTDKGFALIGGSISKMRETLENQLQPNATDKEVRDLYFEQMVKPMLKANMEGFQFIGAKKNNISTIDANNGVVNFAFDLGDGKKIEAEYFSKFLKDIQKEFRDQTADMDLEKTIRAQEMKENQAKTRGKGKQDDDEQ